MSIPTISEAQYRQARGASVIVPEPASPAPLIDTVPRQPICPVFVAHQLAASARLLRLWRRAHGGILTLDALFSAGELGSPRESWAEIAVEHRKMRKDPPRLQVWVNTKLGVSWEDQAGDPVPAGPLMDRRKDWGGALLDSIAVLTADVDMQGCRLEVQVIGWGRDEESQVVDDRAIWGGSSGPRVWAIKGRGGTGVPVWPRRPARTSSTS